MAKVTYKGYSTIGGEFSNTTVYDVELAKRDLLNHFYTRKGERLMSPLFGSVVWDLLFEQMQPDTQEIIFQDAQNIVGQDPRWNLKEAIVTKDDQSIYLDLRLVYVPTVTEETLRLAFKTNTIGNSP
jgi:phage baseplate assembly protein W